MRVTSTTTERDLAQRLQELPAPAEWEEYFERGFADDNPLQVRNRAMFMLMHRTGITLEQACALDLEDLDADTGDVRIRAAGSNPDRVVRFDADESFQTALKHWLAARTRLGSRTTRVFTTWQGDPVCDVAPLVVQMRDAAMRSWHNKGLTPSGRALDEFALRYGYAPPAPADLIRALEAEDV